MELNQSCKIFNEKNKKTLRIRSFESDQSNVADDKLPLDLEIFRNLIDNISRKFDAENGENLICFGGCAVFNSDGTIKCMENFIPKYPSFLKTWIKINTSILEGFLDGRHETLSMSDSEVEKNIRESGEMFKNVRIEGESTFDIDHSTENKSSPIVNPCQHSIKTSCEPQSGPKKCKSLRFKIKQGVPVPPKPVLSLSQDDLKQWFPHLMEKLSGKKFPTSSPRKCPDWDEDVDKVLTLNDFSEQGPKTEFNWSKVSGNFFWKLKLVSAILLDKKGIDYTTFAEKVEERHEKYSIEDLKLMSMSKNPETFEKLFVKKIAHSKSEKPAYLDEFEKKSSEIILKNFRLINARDKKLNGNNVQKTRKVDSSSKLSNSNSSPQSNPNIESTSQAVNGRKEDKEADHVKKILNGIRVTPLIDAEDTSMLLCEEVEQPKNKRKKSADSTREKEEKEKGAKASNQRFLCKNNFQKGDYLIHPSQLHSKFGPVKLVTYRRETKKVFLSVSEFETCESSKDEYVLMEKSSHKNRSTPAKFLDSYVKINEYIELIEKQADKMKIKRSIPKNFIIAKVSDNSEDASSVKDEVIDLDELVNDEAFEEELDELNDDTEMVIDESRN